MLIDIVSSSGRYIDQRVYKNTPLELLYPSIHPIIIQWTEEQKPLPKAFGHDTGDGAIVSEPIKYKGIEYNGSWGWGSSVKKGQTFGLTEDIGCESNMFRFVEDGQRFQRWLMPQGWYGITRRPLRIKLETPGTMTKYGLIEDGFGYIARNSITVNSREAIKLGASRGSYTFWQRIPWDIIADEATPRIIDRLNKINPVHMLQDMHGGFALKSDLVNIDQSMVYHPFVGLAIARQWGEYLARVSTTVPSGSFFRLAVPTECPTIESGDPGSRLVVARYPIDSYSSIQAVEPVYSQRIAEMEVIQYSISSPEIFFKGCAQLVDDLEYDAILCTEDLKMAANGVKRIAFDGYYEGDVCIAVTQHYARGSCIGVNAKWAKDLLGLDHDGDIVEVHPTDNFPSLYEAAQELPIGETPKLPKNKRLLSKGDFRAQMIVQSLQDVVGFASNVTSECLGLKNQDSLAAILGFSSSSALHNRLNLAIKVGTDGFKANIDPSETLHFLSMVQSRTRELGRLAPWTSWPGKNAFVRYIPRVFENAWAEEDGYFALDKGQRISITADEYENCIHRIHTGTCAQIAKLTIPSLEPLLANAISVEPLTYYRNWAEPASEDAIQSVKAIRDWWNIQSARVAWQIPEQVRILKNRLEDEVNTCLERENLTRWEAANALWIVAHSARSLDSTGAVVFFAFPEECKKIVAERPGLSSSISTIVTGVDWQLPGYNHGEFDGEIVDVAVFKNGRIYNRKALVGIVAEDQRQPSSDKYPRNMVGMIALNADQPPIGRYRAKINRTSDNAWTCFLKPEAV